MRAEIKALERRAPITPDNAKKLIATYPSLQILVERSADRIFPDALYQEAGCELVEAGSWKSAPESTLIIGLKELPEEDSPLKHRHIFFAHCYKEQTGWRDILARFDKGKGTILDLEFLVNDQGRRVAAFGRAAGLAGCAVGLMVWCHQQIKPSEPFPSLSPYPSVEELAKAVAHQLAQVNQVTGKTPKVMVMGAKGRCGLGALYFLQEAGVSTFTEWDMAETAKGGPFLEILEHNIFVNCIYLMGSIPPFLTKDMLSASAQRELSVVVDVSCDYTNPSNPLPIYAASTSFVHPTLGVELNNAASSTPLDVVAIDHLPSMVPRESSIDFSNDLFSTLVELIPWTNGTAAPVWDRAAALFQEKVALLH